MGRGTLEDVLEFLELGGIVLGATAACLATYVCVKKGFEKYYERKNLEKDAQDYQGDLPNESPGYEKFSND